jgi:8-oxo-dGTP pyrophosphatase MutT (NUDIX family)
VLIYVIQYDTMNFLKQTKIISRYKKIQKSFWKTVHPFRKWYWSRYGKNLTNARIVLFSSDFKKVLLVQSAYTGVWVLPGGGVDKGETPESACIRELLEESGLVVSEKDLWRIGVYFRKRGNFLQHVHIFTSSLYQGELKSVLSVELSTIYFFSVDELPKEIEKGAKKRIREALEYLHANTLFIKEW